MSILTLAFTKMSGNGNDFVVVDNRGGILVGDGSTFARVVSQRRTGVGADGVVLVENSSRAHFSMKYYNADGSFGGFCGNGGRCIARYAYLHGITPAHLSFESLGHVYQAEVAGERVRLKMKDPTNERLNIKLHIGGKELKMHALNTGAPHVVVFLDENPVFEAKEISALDVFSLGREIRYNSYFGEEGTNVNFVKVNPDKSLSIRTYERGVEGETLACGTGSVASALIASRVKGHRSPQKVVPRSDEPLFVEFHAASDQFENVYLEGNARIIFVGELKYDSVTKRMLE